MAEIVSRWEWRTFGKSLDGQIDLAAYPPVRHVESSEFYLASPICEHNTKIRDQKIDIKILQRVNEDGLEQWKPLLKESFPISADQLTVVYSALNVDPPTDLGDCSFEDVLRLFGEDERTWVVAVDKVRDQYDVDGCTVEVSDVTFDGESFRTVAVEHIDPAKVKDTVAGLGLSGRENINYIEAIQRFKAGTLA